MRPARPSPLTPFGLLPPLTLLPLAETTSAPAAAPTSNPAVSASPAPIAPARGQTLALNGSVAAGLDKSLIKDQTQGYFVVEGVDLLRFAGRRIQAKCVVIGQEQGYPVVRLLEYAISSPDDESPGASSRQGR